MPDLFGSPAMAAGYATSRPPVHPRIIERVAERLRLTDRVERALDVGCGAGLSTRPLQQIARRCFGIEPVEAMLQWAAKTAPEASFAVGRAEALPVRSQSINILTAAGSLNYADLNLFFPEAVRVLRSSGVLVVYDFSQGKSFRESPLLDRWHSEFVRRYPRPAGDSRQELSPEILASWDCGLRLRSHEHFEIGLVLGQRSYLDYAMTETNVAYAVRNGVREEDIRAWCTETLSPVFQGDDKEILFRGYIAYMTALSSERRL
jgi:SAM-dependent methyltransferase